jgi:uncharacterized protein (TIGR02678 family)
MSTLTNQLVIAEREEVARGIRLLLANPLISERSAPEWFDLVRRRREPIRQWFDYYCGWNLIVEPRLGYARLVKVRATDDPTRPARRSRAGQQPFDRRRYVLLCLAASELLTVPVTTIGLLADRVGHSSGADPIISTFDSAIHAERRAFVDVLRLLESYGVIDVVDGATESFVESADAKVLYQVDSTLLLRLLAAPIGPSQLAVPVEEVSLRLRELLDLVTHERRYGQAGDDGYAAPASEVQRNLGLRHSIFRKVADDPVLYLADLTAEEKAYLASPTGRQLLRRAADQGGFVLEERAEGILLVDPEALATDSRFPDDASTAKVAALLLLDSMAGSTVAVEQLRISAEALLSRFPRWARSYQDEDGPAKLVGDALAVLGSFGLVRVTGGLAQPLPAAARYAVSAPRTAESADQEVPS